MKKLNKKGFTIVELVIVIAVIAILAAVLIPTFSGVVNSAKEAAAKEDARTIYTQYAFENPTADLNTNETANEADVIVKSGDYYVSFVDGELQKTLSKDAPATSSTGTAGDPYYTETESGSGIYIYTGEQTA